MNTALKWFLVIAIIAVTFILPASLQSIIQGNTPKPEVTPVQTETPPQSTIFIKSIPPTSVKIGSDFAYRVSVQTTPEQDYTIVVKDKPEWLKWDESQNILTGKVDTVPGTFTATITATTLSGETATQKITVIVTKQESDVKGVSTTISSLDPFHPEIEETPTALPTSAAPTAVWTVGDPTFDGVGTTPAVTQVLGETSTRETSIQVDYLLYGAAILLALSIVYLIVRIISGAGKSTVKKTPSGVVIQSDRS